MWGEKNGVGRGVRFASHLECCLAGMLHACLIKRRFQEITMWYVFLDGMVWEMSQKDAKHRVWRKLHLVQSSRGSHLSCSSKSHHPTAFLQFARSSSPSAPASPLQHLCKFMLLQTRHLSLSSSSNLSLPILRLYKFAMDQSLRDSLPNLQVPLSVLSIRLATTDSLALPTGKKIEVLYLLLFSIKHFCFSLTIGTFLSTTYDLPLLSCLSQD